MELSLLEKCTLCPHECNVNRLKNQVGKCKATSKVKIALANLHYYEEPCISGESGSGTVFFSGCNMSCKFCQNYKISQEGLGKEIEIEKLAEEFIRLQNENANNINLVTGFMYIPQIIEAIKIARTKGLKIPIIYNSSGYEKIESLKLLEGYIDVYLPDFKYFDNKIAKRISGIGNYREIAENAIQEMYRQVGTPQFDKNGIIKKGIIIRHLVLPNYIEDSKNVLKRIKENFNESIYISLMAQYFPTYKALESEEINRKLNTEEYEEIEQYIFDLNFNGYIQDLEENEEQYVPDFEGNNS